jgi:hypothetical protein
VEQYKTCELYDAKTTKTADVCNKIIPYKTNANYIDEDYKCVFDSKNSKCERKKKNAKISLIVIHVLYFLLKIVLIKYAYMKIMHVKKCINLARIITLMRIKMKRDVKP